MSDRSILRRMVAAVSGWTAQTPVARETPPAAAQQQPAAAQQQRVVPGHKARKRMYAAARNTRQTTGFGSSGDSSADAELSTSLPQMRARARQMVRDSSYAKRAKRIVVDNVIGAGVGLQAQVGTNRAGLNERVNSDIEDAFSAWACATSCHTGGKLHFHDLERAAFGQIFEAGEVLIRMHYTAFGDSKVPLTLELIEAERLAHDVVPGALGGDVDVRMGVEVDRFGRPVAYWIRDLHQGDIRARIAANSATYSRVPADQIFHLYIVERWPQTRGEPWLHTALRKIDELNEYTGLEVSAARGSAAYFATITTPEADNGLIDGEDEGGKQVMDLEPLTIQELAPGEELQFHTPNRPNAALDPFMRAMLREIAMGAGCSYASLSGDYSQSNYSSSRLALLDDREQYRALQQWWVRSFRKPLHQRWMQQAAFSGALASVSAAAYGLAPEKFAAARFKPRGWGWIDPAKEVASYKEAIRAGLTTLTDVIAATSGGQDIEDIVKTRARELEMIEAAGYLVDTTVAPEPAAAGPMAAAADPVDEADAGDAVDDDGAPAGRARVVSIARSA